MDFNVRGERVVGHLFLSDKTDPGLSPFVIWVHARAEDEREARLNSVELTLLELHWPLIGPRHDVKLSPLLIGSLSEPEPSAAQNGIWERFCAQAEQEVSAALSGMQSQTECQVGEFSELVLDLESGQQPAQHSIWPASSAGSLDAAQCVRHFLSELRHRDAL
ncbi:MAG: hypothetical protein VX252_01835 [Myxococcota bacterium]|nr:hypothetical protein [Myxococcota bacterium]